jgi:hypothetical protein
MISLQNLPSAHSDHGTREPSQEPVSAAHAREMYAAWQAIFEKARPSHIEPAVARPDQKPAMNEDSDARPGRFAIKDSLGANGANDAAHDVIATALDSVHRTAVRESNAGPGSTAIQGASAPIQQPTDVELLALLPQVASAVVSETAADATARVHCFRPTREQSYSEPRSEVISISVEDAHVSIVVRDAGLTDAEALRAAFETVRELTGRSTSLQQLTLNGRVLYQQASPTDVVASSDVLFAC